MTSDFRLCAVVTCLLTLVLASCAETKGATEVLVVVHSNLMVGPEIDALDVRLVRGGADDLDPSPVHQFALARDPESGQHALPLSFSVAPKKPNSREDFRVVITGLRAGMAVVEQQALASFVPYKSLVLEIFLARACLDVLCRDGDDQRTGEACEARSQSCSEVRPSGDLSVWDGPGSELGAVRDSGPALDAGEDAAEEGDTGTDEMDGSTGAADADASAAMDGDAAGPLQCSAGFEIDAGACTDVDECAKTASLCGVAECRNRDGGYACGDCETGYAPDARGACVDIDECSVGSHNCDAHADCQNRPGSFACSCRVAEGYAGSGTNCVDLDECGNPTLHNCDTMPAACVNRSAAAGRFACTCPAGYSGTGVGTNGCADSNECTEGTPPCSSLATCANSEGGFSCTCPAGFAGNGVGAQGCSPTLVSLTVSIGTLSPAFDPLVNDYSVRLPLWRESIAITGAAPVAATIRIDGSSVGSGQAFSRALTAGANAVPIVVSASGLTRTYTVTVHREAPPPHFLKASNAAGGDFFGTGLALSADRSTLAVGAQGEASATTGVNSTPNEAAPFSGAVYIYRRVAGVWSQEAYVKASNPGANDEFGNALALNADGTLLAVGSAQEDSSTSGINPTPNEAANNAGAVYLFGRAAGGWSQAAFIKAGNAGADAYFGWSVALSADGGALAVGSPWESTSTSGINPPPNRDAFGTGAVYIFRGAGSSWAQDAFLKASSAGASDLFGRSVALSSEGSWLAVGASGEASSTSGVNSTPNEAATGAGAAYVFRYVARSWSQDAYIKASNPGSDDNFGGSVALSGDGMMLAVGAHREGSSSTGVNPTPDDAAQWAGAAYVFRRSTGWMQEAFIKASNTSAQDYFGASLSLSSDGTTLAVGAAGEDSSSVGFNSVSNEGALGAGAAYVLRRNGSGIWAQQAYVKAFNAGANDGYGGAVELSADGLTLMVSAAGEATSNPGVDPTPNDSATNAGAVYCY